MSNNTEYISRFTKGFILFLGLLVATLSNASTSTDSLKQMLNGDLNDSQRVNILNSISKSLNRTQTVESRKYAKEAYTLADKINFAKGKGAALVNLASTELVEGRNESSLEYINEAEILAKENNLQEILAEVYHRKGVVYHVLGNYAEALISYHEALKINQELEIFEAALKQFNNIALVRRELKDYGLALSYLEQYAILAKKINLTDGMYYNQANIGYVYLDLKKYEKALAYVEPVIREYDNVKDSLSLSMGKNVLAQIYLGLKKYDLALSESEAAIALSEKLKYKDGITDGLYTYGETFYQKGDYQTAIKQAEKALSIIDTNMTTRYVDGILNTIVNSYKKIGDKENALKYQDQLIKVKAAIFDVDKEKLAYKLDVDYKTKEKEKENETLRTKLDLGEKILAQQKFLNLLFACLTALFLLLCFILYKSLRDKRAHSTQLELAVEERTTELKEKNQELLTANKELEQFAYITSHDFKEPILTIQSFTKLIDNQIEGKPDLKKYTSFINGSADQLSYLVKKIFEFLNVNNGIKEDFVKVDLNTIVEEVKINLKEYLEEREVLISCQNLPQINGNASLLFVVFKNLIENAVKFNESETPQIEIFCEKDNGFYKIKCKDNGMGIAPEFHETVFEMFKKLDHKEAIKGSGLGLAICKKIIHLHGGKIWVESEKNQGATFLFTLKES